MTNLLRNLTLAILLTTHLAASLAAADAGKFTKGPSIEGITEYTFDNGLKVLLYPDPSKPTVTVNLTILVCSRH